MSTGSSRTLAVIQAHHTDLLPGDRDPAHYSIAPLQKSRCIDRIVIAVADLPDNRQFAEIARAWGVDVFFGSEIDVVERTLRAAESFGAARDAVIARTLLNRFYADAALIDGMIERLRASQSDFVMLPYDFDINFGADVLTLDCLRRVDRALAGGHAHERFRPWLFIEDHPDRFRSITFDEVPQYPPAALDAIRSSGLFPERDYATYSRFTYELIAQQLKPTDIVLDLACATGEGTALLARHCRHVYGLDLTAAAVADARALHHAPNATYDVQRGSALTFPDGFFTAIVSGNTLERVDDDEAMLRSFHRVLQPGARLILESQLLRRRPFNAPVSSQTRRQYDKDALLAMLTRCGFSPVRQFGMNRGMYLGWERAREAVLIHARRAAA
jgi:spore coat polysaccharide biosynthesis protein SpsF (cytidylyltransferase family)